MKESTRDKLWESYGEKRLKLENSDFVESVLQSLEDVGICHIRCLGLGSISDSLLAMYQLCLLNIIESHLNENNKEIQVSLWDPIFTDNEKLFLEDKFKYQVIEDIELVMSKSLFYLPHFPISILETFITESKPIYILSNDLNVYTNKFTDLKYFEQFPNCARLTKLIQDKTAPKPKEEPTEDEFQVVVKKKNRKKKSSLVYTPPIIEYDFESAFFNDVESSVIEQGNKLDHPWDSAFTDLAFMKIIKN